MIDIIIESYINGNFRQFYSQVKDHGVYKFFNELANMINYSSNYDLKLFKDITLKYLIHANY